MPGRNRGASVAGGTRRAASRRVTEHSTSAAASRRSSSTSYSATRRANSRPLESRRSNSLDFERMDSASARGAASSSRSLRERSAERKRKRDKERAGRMFSKQFAGTANSDASENGPRAALFKGEMGRTQRRAARMQTGSAAAAAAFAPLAVLGAIPELLGRVFKSKKSLVIAFIIGCIVFLCAFLYTPTQQYYQSVRETARLQAEYEAVTARNDVIAEENAALQTDAGVETELRERYNYVKAGEETANVSGLSAEASRNESADSVQGIVASGSVKAPDTWYSGVLDAVFGYTS